jgi:hypothetical protein
LRFLIVPPPSDLSQLRASSNYQRAGYRFRIDYRQSLTPAVSSEVAVWLNTLLVEQALR